MELLSESQFRGTVIGFVFLMVINHLSKKIKKAQVTVELLLVLPIFFLMLFFIMELGNLAYQVIVFHHAAYELARIGSLVAGPTGGSATTSPNCGKAVSKMKGVLDTDMKLKCELVPEAACVSTGWDRQAQVGSYDLTVNLTCTARLIFPGSKYFLSTPRRGTGTRKIYVTVRMPIEKPVFR
ncbi:MAG: pilus assembly protein [Elusimicrobia bacterium]|nr:pilus assembly protein [Elusimicrobiota bacterium]